MSQPNASRTLGTLALVVSFIQFANALEYMAFNPIFAFMAPAFAVPLAFSGYVSAAYTFAAMFSGVIAFYFIGAINQRRFLLSNMALLCMLTAMTTLTTHFAVLLALRFFAGLVGGTTMGVAISLLINAAPAQLRGKMVSTVIAAFSMISIVGMPVVLFICSRWGWKTSLLSLSACCLVALALIVRFIPAQQVTSAPRQKIALDAQTLLFASGNALVQFSPMLLIPLLVPLLQLLGATVTELAWLFFAGGIAGYLATRFTGMLTQRYTTLTLALTSSALFVASLLIPALHCSNAWLFMALFLSGAYSRLVSSSVLTLQFPNNAQRAGFGSLQTALMHLATTAAFSLSSWLLSARALTLDALKPLLIICALSALLFPLLVPLLQKKLALRSAASHP
ncbi:major Facilitator Superfamily protein [Enterobacter cloacae S611]|uniref:Major Facilitator Superfamily protein n=1 Tax=Enterobacter cloacae S611 TaxID=1399146 RepID=A0ABP2ZS50_ENTCL|nr:major Facilitator Superfamily protein [Enterobacter cloacae S611]